VRQAGKLQLEVCSFVIGIISRLIAYLMIIIILVQAFLYAGKWRPYFNPIYKMEEQYPTGQPTDNHPYEIIQITGTVLPDENVILLKNGIPLGKIEEGKKILVRLYEGDVLEIDARAVNRPGRIEFSSLYGEKDSDTWNGRIMIGKKLYRFQPFSFKSPCT